MGKIASLSRDITKRAESWASATSALYAVRSEDGCLEAVGSAILVEHGDLPFLVTASHVLTNNRTVPLLAGGTVAIPVNDRYFRSADEDGYDVAFIPLSEKQKLQFGEAQFITKRDVARADRIPRQYYIVGYRADNNLSEEAEANVTSSWSGYAAMSAPADVYEARSLGADRLLLTFDRTALFGSEGLVDPEPEPEGLSGAGIWRRFADPENDKLVAIVDGHSDTGRLIYGTSLWPLFSWLDQHVKRISY